MKNIKNICLLSLTFACALPITADEQPALKSATPEEIASCSNKLGLVSALRNRVVTLLPITTAATAIIASDFAAPRIAMIAGAIASLTAGVACFSSASYLSNKYEQYYDAESFECIKKNARIASLIYGFAVDIGVIYSVFLVLATVSLTLE